MRHHVAWASMIARATRSGQTSKTIRASGASMKRSTIGAMTGLFMVLGAATLARDVNCGGPAVGQFVADEGFTGGGTISHKDVINVSGVPPFVGAQVFQTGRVGSFTYTFGPYPANWPVAIRLFFAE